MRLNTYIDHTLLKPSATETDIIQLCEEAKKYKFHSVCVHSYFVELAYTLLTHSKVKTCSVVGFPLGAMATEVKVFETAYAIEKGAEEIDMVININLLKSRNYRAVLNDISEVKKACGNKVLKVIIETSELSKNEIIEACEICVKAKVDFVKTSTGFGSKGATLSDVRIMKKTVKDKLKIKASGGIRDYDTALQFINVGAERLGTSSGTKIMNQAKNAKV